MERARAARQKRDRRGDADDGDTALMVPEPQRILTGEEEDGQGA